MKRALLIGILCWIIIFVEASVIGFTPGLATQGEHGFTLLPIGFMLHFALLAVLSWLLAKLFYKKKPTGIAENPIIAGAIVIGIGFILDAIVTVPFFVKDYGHYYSKWTLWVGSLIFVAVFAMVGKSKSKS